MLLHILSNFFIYNPDISYWRCRDLSLVFNIRKDFSLLRIDHLKYLSVFEVYNTDFCL